MARINCTVESCRHHNSAEQSCNLDWITISDATMTAAGFLPQCEDFREKTESEGTE